MSFRPRRTVSIAGSANPGRASLGSLARLVCLGLLAAAGCGAEPGTLPPSDPNRPRMALTSTAFAEGQLIPRDYTCDGKNMSPPLSWSGAPTGASIFIHDFPQTSS